MLQSVSTSAWLPKISKARAPMPLCWRRQALLQIVMLKPFVKAFSRSCPIKRGGNIWIRIFPDKPITKKPLEVRMGKGKGNVEYWVSLVQPGTVLYEMAGVSEEVAREAFKLAAAKLPVRTTFIKKAL